MISINEAPPRVDIILLNWNGWQDSVACLNSLTMLNYSNHRLLVVDNGSTDDSVKRIRVDHPDVHIIETGRNLGFSGGCNVGIRRALEEGADYVWLLNNDTTVDPQALSRMVAVAEAEPKIGAVGSVLYYMDNPTDIQAWGGGRVSFWTGRAHQYRTPVPGANFQYLTAASILLRRSALEQIGLLDETTFFMYWEDTDISFRLRNAGWRLAVADQSIVFHREHASTGKGNPLLDFYFNESAVRFFRRHAPVPAWPIVIGSLGRIGKRIWGRNQARFISTIRGIYAGLQKADKEGLAHHNSSF